MRKYLILMAAAIGASASAANAAPTIADSSFENPLLTAGSYQYGGVPGATFSGLSGIASNGSPLGFAAAPDGNQIAFLEGQDGKNGQFSMGVSGLEFGTKYLFSFLAAGAPNAGANQFTVSFNGAVLGTYSVTDSAFRLFTTDPVTATATGGILTFTGSFGSSSVPEILVGIDNLKFTDAAVPEPKTWAMMLLGFLAIGAAVRRRKPKLLQVA